MRISDPKKFTQDKIEHEKQESGAYIYLNEAGEAIYIGVSEDVEERLLAGYYGRADYSQVEEKRQLRKQIREYRTVYTDIERARKLEHNKKDEMRFNQL